ncbi:hypothetical protein A5789_23570 [Nocardia sp. 852002-51101_SCH5132738]|nr:hypothetical protein A5789_23570 [Nocardia sp. 852002-51101_SCH5132738]OBB34807.1 hypothetical protein A5748_06320 [Nocardia sp. 852002-51244_SCH5132740]OBF80985.1 hypothetical protein A9X06_20435 [Mycobacterium sp. 852002-51759_SCH5129042]
MRFIFWLTYPFGVCVVLDERYKRITATKTDSLVVLGFDSLIHGFLCACKSAPWPADVFHLVFVGLDFELFVQDGSESDVIGQSLVQTFEVRLVIEVGRVGNNPESLFA